MERSATLIRFPVGEPATRRCAELAAQVVRIVESAGGVSEGLWELGEDPGELLSVARFPDEGAVRRARTGIETLGLLTRDWYPVDEMRECLQAMCA